MDVTHGPHQGEKFSLHGRTSLGRKGTSICLNDSKLSEIHAYFDFSQTTGWFIEDNKSRNGVWVNGFKETRVALKNKDVIQVGEHQLLCRLFPKKSFYWSSPFHNWLKGVPSQLKNEEMVLRPVNPEICLRVTQGVQYGECWNIFYGPRKAGKGSEDICLRDKQALEETFEVIVKGNYAYFFTKNENIVKLNNQTMKEKQFTPGDVISFGETKIQVEINEDHGFSS